MPSKMTRTEKGQNSEHTGPRVSGIVGTVGSSWKVLPWVVRPAITRTDAIQQTAPKPNAVQVVVSSVPTQLGTRGRPPVSVPKAFSNGGPKTGQIIAFNDSAHLKTTTTLTPRPRTRSPEDWRHSTGQLLNCVPEDAEMSVDQTRAARRSETSLAGVVSASPHLTQTYYGSTPVTAYPASLELGSEYELSEQDEEYLLDEELARSGLYRGHYKNFVLLYTFVPLTTLLAFVIFAYLPVFAFHSSAPSAFPYPPYLPYPLPEVLTAAAFWSLSHLLRDTLYETSVSLVSWIPTSHRFPNSTPFLTSLLAGILQNISALILRQFTVQILLIPLYSTERPRLYDGGLYTVHHNFPTWEDVAFKRIWWIALGSAAAEAVVGIKQGYEKIALYKDVLVNVRKTVKEETSRTNHPISSTDVTAGTIQVGVPSHDQAAQKSSESKRPLADREAHNNVELFRRRDHSSSLSSIASGPYDDLPASAILERQPLLSLRRQPVENFVPATGLGNMAEDADRGLVESIVEQDLQELMCLKSREEIEELYGMPVIRIPVFISCLHRINSILASLASYLMLTAAFMRSTFAYDYSYQGRSPSRSALRYLQLFFPPSQTFHPAAQSSHPMSGSFATRHPFSPSNRALVISVTVLLGVHTVFSVLHAPWILPRIGVHTFVYVSLLVWLGLFLGALGVWGALS